MALFQSVLLLLLLAILSLQVSRRLRIPYPTMLAVAGLGVAMLPSAPEIAIEPHLVMTLFIAPAILDAAYDFPLRAIRRYWLPLFALAVVAVLLTTAAVAWVGVTYAGLPLAAAVALGAIVAPPDAAAAAAMLERPDLPRSTATVLKGESLLNDAVALLVFSVALHVGSMDGDTQRAVPQLALAIPGGLLLGIAMGRLAAFVMPFLAGTLGGILFSFVFTFGTWIIADWLGLSAILAMVASAMTVARRYDQGAARDRIHAYAVWDLVVFLLNVLAFLFVGLQARVIVRGFDATELRHALAFAALVFATVVVVRIVWVVLYNRLVQPVYRWLGYGASPTLKQGIVASWCGMRGMVTLAAALALPEAFPQRGLVVLSALAVVLGTLIVQGITLEPLIRLLRFPVDTTQHEDLERARGALATVAQTELEKRDDAAAKLLREELRLERISDQRSAQESDSAVDALRLASISAQRAALWRMLRDGAVRVDTFRVLERELDLSEVAASRREVFDLVDS
ncbi:MAG TPA: cation:proton antiporter [Rudaea sp.]|nr:cation:proton antiporter [Rudaea sp.]